MNEEFEVAQAFVKELQSKEEARVDVEVNFQADLCSNQQVEPWHAKYIKFLENPPSVQKVRRIASLVFSFGFPRLQVEEEGVLDQGVRIRECFGLMMDIQGDINAFPRICPSPLDCSKSQLLYANSSVPLEVEEFCYVSDLVITNVKVSSRLERSLVSSQEDCHPS